MDFVREHINETLNSISPVSDPEFDLVFTELQNSQKEKLRPLFKYLNSIIDNYESKDNEDVDFIHIHFPVTDDQCISSILEWLIIKEFYSHYRNESNRTDETLSFIEKELAYLERVINDPSIPPEASAKNGGNKAYKIHTERKKHLKEIRAYYKQLSLNKITPSKEFRPSTVINLLHKEQEFQKNNFFRSRGYAMSLEDINSNTSPKRASYVLMNDSLNIEGIDSLKLNDQSLLNDIKNVIIFDCASQVKFSGYNYRTLIEFNKEGTQIKKLIVFSFEKNMFYLSRIMSKLKAINSKLYVQPTGLSFHSYVIHPYEFQQLTDTPTQWPEVSFVGDTSVNCYELCELIQDIIELKELYSIKMRNIYSMCWNSDITKLVLDDIFDPGIEPKLISHSTKESLLKQNSLDKIKELLTSILKLVESFGSRFISKCSKRDGATVIIPYAVLNHDELFSMIESAMGNQTIYYGTWRSVKEDEDDYDHMIILDYRDCGSFPFSIVPNIHEINSAKNKPIHGFFLTMFFKGIYDYTKHRYTKTLFDQVMGHSFRNGKLNWGSLKTKIDRSNPQNEDLQNLWDIDNVYERDYDHVSIEFHFDNDLKRKFYPSQLIIFSGSDNIKHVETAENLFENYSDKKLSVQLLEKTYEGIHLFEFTDEEREELNEIQSKYDLDAQEKKSELWKVFLLRRTVESNLDSVYDEIEKIAVLNSTKFVSKNHFQNSWLNYNSETLIPRSKKMFKLICDYLELPNTYFRLMLKQRAKERLNARHSNSQMNAFLQSLVNFGLFDQVSTLDKNNEDHRKFVKELIDNHDLEEIGIVPDNIYNEIMAFIDLIKDNIKLEPVKTIKKIN